MDESTAGTDRIATRRAVLGGVGAACLGAVAGCLGDDGASGPDPISIDEDHSCDQCTMVVGNHPGPAGQAHYENPTDVLDEERPAQFCSSLCAYTFSFDNESTAEPTAIHLTDYSTVDYEVDSSGETNTISRHLEAEAFKNVSALTLVADSEVEGAMGSSLIPFTDSDEAETFQEEYGGEIYEHDDITQEFVMSLM
ncbi:nitrous oxide reductase accessory protein NosL [Natronorubrum thiooxidans]|uniref:Nitrous oxide reductase accessory protein NosL n=1 Tax=Natronorubrum thiooxidans TaxID=308853 RepID=A0A1N7DBZ0_9EURY|nr:nitrous oxide reductase accessory protein NosL [Natronorubrum thiooxidans]SIR73359.1 Nitrous oxide reductase accessory protein NosL [Natronorubrum thiooxidans]